MGQFSRDVKMLAALGEDLRAGDRLLDATRKLCGAFSDLLNAAQPGSKEVNFYISFSLYYGSVFWGGDILFIPVYIMVF